MGRKIQMGDFYIRAKKDHINNNEKKLAVVINMYCCLKSA